MDGKHIVGMSSKLRTSCNSCHDTKVKCVKDRTANSVCTRCKSLNQACQYSPLMPRIYRKRRKLSCPSHVRRSARSRSKSFASDSLPNGTDGILPSIPPLHNFQVPPADRQIDPVLSALSNAFNFGQDKGEAQWAPAREFRAEQFFDLPKCNSYDELLETFPSEHASVDSLVLRNGTSPEREIRCIYWPQTLLSPNSEAEERQPHHLESSSYNTPFIQRVAKLPHVQNHGTRFGNCLNLLQLTMQSQSSNFESPIPTIDCILNTNRSAILNCQAVLHCMCRANETWFSTMVCALLEMVLSSYDSAFNSFLRSLDDSWSDEDDLWSEQRRDRQANRSVKLSLGSFNLNKQDQVSYVRRLVKREVREVKKVLQKLSEWINSHGLFEALVTQSIHRCNIVELGFRRSKISPDSGSDEPST